MDKLPVAARVKDGYSFVRDGYLIKVEAGACYILECDALSALAAKDVRIKELREALLAARDCILIDRALAVHFDHGLGRVDDDGQDGLDDYDAVLSQIDAALSKED